MDGQLRSATPEELAGGHESGDAPVLLAPSFEVETEEAIHSLYQRFRNAASRG